MNPKANTAQVVEHTPERNAFGMVSIEVSQHILRAIFPEYPDTHICKPVPKGV